MRLGRSRAPNQLAHIATRRIGDFWWPSEAARRRTRRIGELCGADVMSEASESCVAVKSTASATYFVSEMRTRAELAGSATYVVHAASPPKRNSPSRRLLVAVSCNPSPYSPNRRLLTSHAEAVMTTGSTGSPDRRLSIRRRRWSSPRRRQVWPREPVRQFTRAKKSVGRSSGATEMTDLSLSPTCSNSVIRGELRHHEDRVCRSGVAKCAHLIEMVVLVEHRPGSAVSPPRASPTPVRRPTAIGKPAGWNRPYAGRA